MYSNKVKLPIPKPKRFARRKDAQARKKLLDEAIESSLSLTQIREKIAAMTPKKEQEDLKVRFDSTYKMVKKDKQLWQDPKKKKKLQSLLAQLEKLMET